SAGHDPIISSSCTVAIKVFHRDTVFLQIKSGGGCLFDGAGRADVIGRNRVAKNGKRPRTSNVTNISQTHAELIEKGRFLNVRRFWIPLVDIAGSGWYIVPHRILLSEIAVKTSISLWIKSGHQAISNFCRAGPNVTQKYVTRFPLADRIGCQVDV